MNPGCLTITAFAALVLGLGVLYGPAEAFECAATGMLLVLLKIEGRP